MLRSLLLWFLWLMVAILVLLLMSAVFFISRSALYDQTIGGGETACTVMRVDAALRDNRIVPVKVFIDCPEFRSLWLDQRRTPEDATRILKPGDILTCPVTTVEGPAGLTGSRTKTYRSLDQRRRCWYQKE